MNITTINVTYGRKFNLGNYEQLHIELTASAELDEDDSTADCETQLFDHIKQQVKRQSLPVIAHSKTEVAQAFLALPEEQQNEIMDYAYSVGRNGKPDDEDYDDRKNDIAEQPDEVFNIGDK